MNDPIPSDQISGLDLPSPPPPDLDQVRQEQRRLKEESEEVRQRFRATRVSYKETWAGLVRKHGAASIDRDLRNAALNLLEDTEHARLGEQQEAANAARIDQALRARTQENSALVDVLPVFVWTCLDKECRVITGNHAANELLGVEAGSNVSQTSVARGEAVYLRQLKEDGSEYLPEELPMQRALATGQPVRDALIDFRFPDGRRVLALGNAVPLLDEHGKPRGAVAAFIDVTAQKRLEEERRRAERDAHFLAETSHDLVGLSEVGEIMETVGARLGAHLGLSLVNFVEVNEGADEVVVNHAWHRPEVPSSLGTYPLAEYVAAEYQATLRAGEPFIVRDTAADPRTDAARFAALKIGAFLCTPLVRGGRWRFVLTIHHCAPHDWQPAEIALTREVTARLWTRLERVRFEAALYESEARFRAAVGAVSSLIWTNNAAGMMVGEQPGWSGFTGQSPAEYEGYGWSKAVHPEDAQPTIVEWERAVAEKRLFEFEHRLRRHDGAWRLCSIRAVPVLAENGAIREWVGVHTDITDQRAAAAALREAKEAAEAANQAKDRFLAVLSHELRTPLTPVLGVAESLLRQKTLSPRMVEGLQMICRNVQLQTHLINDLLDLTKISHGTLELCRQPANLHDVVKGAVEISSPDIRGRHQHLNVALNAKQQRVHADVTRLQQVFWNLLKNGSKFTPDLGEMRISSRNEAGVIVVEISDTGIGLSPEALRPIFEPFCQADASIAPRFGGLGLGLAISKATVEAHGGTIEAASAGPGRGSTFTVRLPLEEIL